MSRLIYRVDDRFIHGQVVEGWINYYQIPRIIIVNDVIASDTCQRLIYSSSLPESVVISFYSTEDFIKSRNIICAENIDTLIIVGSIEDLYKINSDIAGNAYINLGCLATSSRMFEINDTVYLSESDLEKILEILKTHPIYAHKVAWEEPVDVANFIKKRKRSAK